MDKILKIQSEIGVLSKTETNPFFKSKYLDINGILTNLQPLLAKHNLLVTQPLCEVGGKPCLMTEVFDIVNNQSLIKGFMPLPDLQDPQKMGSAITYYRRYSLQSLFLLQAEDDDGNKGAEKEVIKKIDPATAFNNAKEAIQSANNLNVLMDIEKSISKSKNLTAENKEELSFLANERRMDFDPTE